MYVALDFLLVLLLTSDTDRDLQESVPCCTR